MLFIYGTLMPLRVLEEIRFWKMQEKEHTVVIRELIPDLELEYVTQLQQWEQIFAQTEAAAVQWIEAVIRSQIPFSPYLTDKINELTRISMSQSQQFITLLFSMQANSRPIISNPVSQTVIQHIIRESEYFLGVLHAMLSSAPAGIIQDSLPQPPATFRQIQERLAQLHSTPSLTREDETRAEEEHSDSLTATNEGTWSAVQPYQKPVPIGGHKLPPLPYAHNALEPYIDAETMQLHHGKHHRSYVEALNKAEKMLARARETGDFALIKHWEREIAFNGAGHYLHTLFWNNMKPQGGGKATGAIAADINKSFGSFQAFQKHFTSAAEKVEGGGWAILVWSPRSHRLEILQAEKHQNLSQWDVIPLLALDVWEHAYYLKYNNDRAAYIDAWWHTVNWDHVNERFASARMLKWLPY
ncbi:MAG: superoxide dismutase [Paenibacillus sp.]|jgi:Fe-Mn family superoxide dismutase|nr:superoxide dismutase [Paenibacillus sp.]